MIHSTRLAIAAAALAGTMALAGCQTDGAMAPSTGSAPRIAAGDTRPAAATPPAPGSPVALSDAGGANTWTDADGHVYEVLFGVNNDLPSVSHYRDGALFAVSRQEPAGTTVAFYVGGLVLDEQFIAAAGPQGARAFADGDPVVRRPVDSDVASQPYRMMQPLCADELRAYLIASGEMIAAGFFMQRYPNRKSRTAFILAVANFASAWNALYQCEAG